MSEDYDPYLDLCLDILSEKKYENIIYTMISMNNKQWIRMNNIQELSSFPNNIYFLYDTLPNLGDLIFIFINMETLEINTAIYYMDNKAHRLV
ncbi:hypothetical protein CPI23_08755 [Moraxella catarrhalis]|uniref:hypothetical protein n=2 Tax=Moraxella catarrhalis TaxID=480 RepID=UPI00128C6D31|nr:hypothetical protein [Moraxella catarrhalis]MPW95565.1 hypothetical protein [Moraxella catarrhalis]MPW98991.1 hypothetical protein [Moraxella catarrhalis]MPX09427.1 hypothetical protein [Moraxella catarrhalis]MPX28334.1 hypothetical protein [Moraxella catarrhalis]MPX67227.1 hypothetical protein [Moraxella catarrhalis]